MRIPFGGSVTACNKQPGAQRRGMSLLSCRCVQEIGRTCCAWKPEAAAWHCYSMAMHVLTLPKHSYADMASQWPVVPHLTATLNAVLNLLKGACGW